MKNWLRYWKFWLPGAVVLGALLTGSLYRRQLRSQVQRCRQELTARGEQLTTAELRGAARLRVPPAAADALRTAIQQLGVLPQPCQVDCPLFAPHPPWAVPVWQVPVLPGNTTTNVWPALAAELDRRHTALRQVQQILQQPDLNLPALLWNESLSDPPNPLDLRDLQSWLEAEMLYALHTGQPQLAWPPLQALTTLVLAQAQCRPYPSRGALTRGVAATWQALQHSAWTDAQLAQLQAAWQTADFAEYCEHAIVWTRAESLVWLADARVRGRALWPTCMCGDALSLGGFLGELLDEASRQPAQAAEALARATVGSLLWQGFESHREELRLLQRSQFALASLRVQPDDPQRLLRALGARPARPPAWLTGFPDETIDRSLLEITTIRLTHETWRALVVTAVAVRRQELRAGRLPGSLDELEPAILSAVPRDPMDGQPLRYELREAGGFALGSVGWGASSTPVSALTQLSRNGVSFTWPQPAPADVAHRWVAERLEQVLALAPSAEPTAQQARVVEMMRRRYGLGPTPK